MQVKDKTRTIVASGQSRRKRKSCLLLVGSQTAFRNADIARVFAGPRFQLVAQSSSLVEALTCLAPGAIDVVLISNEFAEDALDLFASEARRRGYQGLILHPVDARERAQDVRPPEAHSIKAGDLVLDLASHKASIRGMELRCSSLEFELLALFSKHPGESLSHGTLLEALWGDPTGQRHSLRELIRSVRAKIETTRPPRYIITQRQFGYRFVPSPTTSS